MLVGLNSCKILSCKEEIKEYLGNISDYMFRKYVKRGMPARCEGREWIAYSDNLDEWYKQYTRISMKNAIDEELIDAPLQ